ncbi:MAG: hypothetical protein WKF83_18075 [Nocardioidaceae bacterium]
MTLILELREKLTTAGLDAGPDTIAWHLQTASPDPGLAGHDQPLPDQSWAGGPRAEEATQVLLHPVPGRDAEPDMGQSDFTHYRLTTPVGGPGEGCRDHQLAQRLHPLHLNVTAHVRVSGPIVLTSTGGTGVESSGVMGGGAH